ncbi:hypothetical protein RIR_e38615_A0A2N0S6V5_9GLOM [Rhizophagus irregularis DAOM 181602=DAOM 197198]|nr:hypothetical protein RIR_e38615_A0A2N0S6V5_9GLOM [Rhizophagus irregularis DAOM 181602=DAOM 197198]
MRTLACFRDFNSFIFIIIDCVLKNSINTVSKCFSLALY